MKSLVIRMGLRLQPILLHIKVPGMSHQEEVDTKHWKDYTFLLAWECLDVPLDELEEEETREKKNCCIRYPDLDKQQKLSSGI